MSQKLALNDAPLNLDQETEMTIEEAIAEARTSIERFRGKVDAPETKRHAVLIETDQSIAEELCRRFKQTHRIIVFKDVREALNAIKARSPDLVILNIHWRGIPVFEIIGCMKQIDPYLPVMMHNGHWGNVTCASSRVTGAVNCLCDFDELHAGSVYGSGRPAAEIYDDLARRLVFNLLENFERNTHCERSVLFDQCEGRVISQQEMMAMDFRSIAGKDDLLPFCCISDELSGIREIEHRGLCPFYRDVNPKENPRRYHTEYFRSHPCGYYAHAASKGVDPQILRKMRQRLGMPCEPVITHRQAMRSPALWHVLAGMLTRLFRTARMLAWTAFR